MSSTKLSVRIHPENLNHHLQDNHGTWWCHLTLHRDDGTKERQRLSLHTNDIAEARKRRDRLFAAYRDNEGALELECRMVDKGVLIIKRQMDADDPLFTSGWRLSSGGKLVRPPRASATVVHP